MSDRPPYVVDATLAQIVGVRADSAFCSGPISVLLARLVGLTSRTPLPTRTLWRPASAGSVLLGYASMVTVSGIASGSAWGLPLWGAVAAGLVLGAIAVALAGEATTDLVCSAPGRRTYLRPAAVSLFGAALAVAPCLSVWGMGRDAFARLSGVGRLAVALLPPLASASIVTTALLMLPALRPRWNAEPALRRRFPAAPEAVLARTTSESGGQLVRALRWLGGLRTDIVTRWPSMDREASTAGAVVASCGLVGGAAAYAASDAISPATWPIGALAAVSWGWLCAAALRHLLVLGDRRDGTRPAWPGRVGAFWTAGLLGTMTGVLLVLGLLLRSGAFGASSVLAPSLSVEGVVDDLTRSPSVGAAALILWVFSVFSFSLPLQRWGGTGTDLYRVRRGLFDRALWTEGVIHDH